MSRDIEVWADWPESQYFRNGQLVELRFGHGGGSLFQDCSHNGMQGDELCPLRCKQMEAARSCTQHIRAGTGPHGSRI